MPINILKGKIYKMRTRIGCDCMRVWHRKFTVQNQFLPAQMKDGNIARFRGDVKPSEARLKGQHIRMPPHWMSSQNLHRLEVDHAKRVVAFASHERKTVSGVDGNAMR